MRLQISKGQERSVVDVDYEQLLELNKVFNISPIGRVVDFTEPFDLVVVQASKQGMGTLFPLTQLFLNGSYNSLPVGILERDLQLKKALEISFLMPQRILTNISIYLKRGNGSDVTLLSNIFEGQFNIVKEERKACVVAYLLLSGYKELVEANQEFFIVDGISFKFIKEVVSELEVMNGLLFVR